MVGHQQDERIRFHHEVENLFRLLGAELVVDMKLPLCRLEPLAGVAFKDDGEAALGGSLGNYQEFPNGSIRPRPPSWCSSRKAAVYLNGTQIARRAPIPMQYGAVPFGYCALR